YHRLAVLTLALPPLRDRGRDIVLLAELFLARACSDYGLPPKRLAPDVQARLLAHSWPGNVRELANMAERLALLLQDDLVRGDASPPPPPPGSLSPDTAGAATSPASLGDKMREHLRAALTETGWNITRTAVSLGISRNTLRARIRKYGLEGDGATAPAPIAAT